MSETQRARPWSNDSYIAHVLRQPCAGCGLTPSMRYIYDSPTKLFRRAASDTFATPVCVVCEKEWQEQTIFANCTRYESRMRVYDAQRRALASFLERVIKSDRELEDTKPGFRRRPKA